MKRLPATLDVKADRIDHAVGAGDRTGDRALIVNVGFDRLKLRIVRSEQLSASLRMS
jgi:hypothetical protein